MDDQEKKSVERHVSCCQPDSKLVSVTESVVPKPSSDWPWIVGTIRTAAGEIPIISTSLQGSDRIGSWKSRWGIGRMNYVVTPGLYAVGHPNEKSHVFVSANYKMSFDRLRSALDGLDAWVVVIDTKGINVWCAAGKGTFGTDEIVRRVAAVKLNQVVSHRRLILPQLAAPGVRAHEVKRLCGFRIIYGPVRASDIRAYLDAGMKATPGMRVVTFTMKNRIVLAPVELRQTEKYLLIVAASILILSGLGPGVLSLHRMLTFGLIGAAISICTVVAGSTLPAILLPYLPGRSFAIKGVWIGIGISILLAGLYLGHPEILRNWISGAGWFCMIIAVTSFLAMNFTGSSTYTSLSGVLKEMRVAVPAQIVLALVGIGLWFTGLFV